jgi:hypothetical protein
VRERGAAEQEDWMKSPLDEVEAWLLRARAKLQNGGLHAADLDALSAALHERRAVTRQRLLYLHAVTPSIRSQVMGMALHEPVPGSITQITSEQEWPYNTVHDAIVDGWQVLQCPEQRVPFDDREIDVLGYEFILQKLETYDG